MRQLSADDLIPLDLYETLRDRYRQRVIEHKRHRRLSLGPATLIFENASTVLHQVLEVLRLESPYRYMDMARELDQYRTLLASPGELRATLMVERAVGEAPVTEILPQLCDGMKLQLGPHEVRVELLDAEPIGWVGYVRFTFDARARQLLRAVDATPLLHVQVPGWSSLVAVPPDIQAQLIADLDGTAPLIHPLDGLETDAVAAE